MDETVNEIEAHIDRSRERLGSSLRELQDKVSAATDWREYFKERPQLFLGGAFVGGVILAAVLGTKSPRRHASGGEARGSRLTHRGGATQEQARELWDNVKGALMGVASAQIKEYISGLVPGFDEQFRRVEQRAAASNGTTGELGRTSRVNG